MTSITIGILGCLLVIILLILGMPIAFLMMLVGFLGIWKLTSFETALSVITKNLYGVVSHYPYTIIPLFVLMGGLANVGGITAKLYDAFDKWFRRLPGGLALATIGACAGFAAISGSSVAAAAAMGNIALPEMRRFNYHPKLATGVIAAGGTLSFLIPPSLGFVVYGILTGQSIGKLLIAGIIPGLILTFFYMAITVFQVLLNPSLAPKVITGSSWKEKLYALKGIWETLLVFLVVIGGIYSGFITPTEAGAAGTFLLFLIVIFKGKIRIQSLLNALFETVRISVMVLFLVAGANVFSYFLALSTIPVAVSNWIVSLELSRYVVFFIIIIIYLILGCFLDAISMMVLTLPVVFPLILALGFDPIWFGVTAVLMMEAGLITPPVGLNVYTVAGLVKDVPMEEIFKGALPYVIAIIFTLLILLIFPQLALFLPSLMLRIS
jgi:tripartite ATP-independent transporter DctM subunit